MAKTKPAATQARVLLDLSIDGVPYRVDQVIEADAQTIANFPNELDAHPDAVAYAISQGAAVIVHQPTEQE